VNASEANIQRAPAEPPSDLSAYATLVVFRPGAPGTGAIVLFIKLAAARGAVWNFAVGVSARALGLVGTLVLTHLLSPAEYGEVSVAAICALTVSQMLNLSPGTYIIVNRSAPAEAFQAALLHVGAAGMGTLALLLVREPLGRATGSPGMTRYLPGLALAALITSVSTIPSATLVRSLRFRVVAICRGLGELVYTALSVSLAPFLGGFAIVAGSLGRALTVAGMLFLSSDPREWLCWTTFRLRVVGDVFRFGLPLSVSGLSETLTGNADNLLVSGLFGPRILGQYNLAYNLAQTPSGLVVDQGGDVLFPSLASLEEERRRSGLPRASALLALILYPLAVGLAVVAPTAVRGLLDPRWSDVAPMLAVLALMAVPRPLTWALDAYMQVRKHNKALMAVRIFRTVAVLGLVFTIGRLGPLWACGAVVVGFCLHAAVFVAAAHRLERLAIWPLLEALMPPLAASVVMAAAVLLFQHWTCAIGLSPGWALPLEIAVGAVFYVAGAWWLARATCRELLTLAGSLVPGRQI
jgi:lipopolysaccharide exporter